MTAKFIDGPWVANGRWIGTANHKASICEIKDSPSSLIAEAFSGSGCRSDTDRSKSNAKLIAAAPSLLYGLAAAMDFIKKTPCDSDITNDQEEAAKKLMELKPYELLEQFGVKL